MKGSPPCVIHPIFFNLLRLSYHLLTVVKTKHSKRKYVTNFTPQIFLSQFLFFIDKVGTRSDKKGSTPGYLGSETLFKRR